MARRVGAYYCAVCVSDCHSLQNFCSARRGSANLPDDPDGPIAAQNAGGLSAMRAYFDTQFNAPVRTEVIANGTVTKTLELLSLKTVEKQTLPKAVDYRNEVTRDKTRLQITGAALNLRWPSAIFEPASLAQPATTPAADRITRIDP